MSRQDVIDALIAERYGPSLWWPTPEPTHDMDDDVTTARRRRVAEREAREHDEEATA